jgi:hypothetical protein
VGTIPADKIQRWLRGAGQAGKSQAVIDRVLTAVEFLERTARMSEPQACSCLTGIDFSMPVSVVRLPPKVYVQYANAHNGIWFTDTGLTPDLVGLAEGRRVRKLFTPIGTVHALKSTARAIKDTWTPDRLFQSIAPAAAGRLGQLTRGGGTQYVVHDKSAMKEL